MPSTHKPSYLVIRYDDFGAAHSPQCAARLLVEQMLCREMAARSWPWLCAITPLQSVNPDHASETGRVPLQNDPDRVALLRDVMHDGCAEPAVHGLTHHTWKQLPRFGTEFAGLPQDKQYHILREAKDRVEQLVGRASPVFVPPWNSFDQATVRAARQAGFEMISAGLLEPVANPTDIAMVPATIEAVHLQQMLDAEQTILPGSVMVLLVHAPDFRVADPHAGYLDLHEFVPLIDRAIEKLDLEVIPIRQIPSRVTSGLDRRVQRAVDLFDHREALYDLPVWGRYAQKTLLPYAAVLLPEPAAMRVSLALNALLALGCLIWMTVVGLGTFAIVRISPGWGRHAVAAICACAGVALTAHAARNAWLKRFRGRWGTRRVGYRTWTALVTGSAAVTALIIHLSLS
ncbi:MAG TPA: DUF2334 domain-containing protein [Phycisphaerae bacterium]|nr:DUF2334 domain-containing protein [Phycisphaerae bacterium]